MTAVRFIRVWPGGENLTPNPRRKNSLLTCLGGVSHKKKSKYHNCTENHSAVSQRDSGGAANTAGISN
jgi:hypothetical protein